VGTLQVKYILHKNIDADCFILLYCTYADKREVGLTNLSHINLPQYASEKGKMRGKDREIQEAALEMEAASFTEMLVSTYKTSWCHNPDDLNLE
jgi:tRNA 2-selenouridine synthase SelU